MTILVDGALVALPGSQSQQSQHSQSQIHNSELEEPMLWNPTTAREEKK